MSNSKPPANLPYFQVNSFANGPFGGNPAGVCPLESWLGEDLMLKIAAENDLSETAFFVKKKEDAYDLRWFTPALEVQFCGHATLASGFVILTILRPDLGLVNFSTRVGRLSVRKGEKGAMVMDAPALPGKDIEIGPDHLALFNKKPSRVLKSSENFLCVFDGGEEEILSLEPDFRAMAKFPDFGFIATAKGSATDFYSRYFAPNHGVPEDPVTGSAHSVLAPYWAGVLGKDKMSARQGSKRRGDLVVELKKDRVDISGRCFLVKDGNFYLSKKI